MYVYLKTEISAACKMILERYIFTHVKRKGNANAKPNKECGAKYDIGAALSSYLSILLITSSKCDFVQLR